MITGSDSQWEELMKDIGELESTEFLAELGHDLAVVVDDQIREGFKSSQDPYGQQWAPRAQEYPWPPLLKTYEMAGTFITTGNSDGVTVENPTVYASFHQLGTRRMDARPMLPVGQDLGRWEQPMIEATVKAVEKVFKR
jgi:phage gpG-like protein